MKGLIVANWKMNKTPSESTSYVREFLKLVDGVDLGDLGVGIAPPFTSLQAVSELLEGTPVSLVAQNMYFEDSGAFTGEVSPVMLKELSCSFVILGHSERRNIFGETDDLINKKVLAALSHGLFPILCVGELLEDRESGREKEVVSRQIKSCLSGVEGKVVVAYEPVWAIGTGRTPTPSDIESMHGFIRDVLSSMPVDPLVIYGGSVNEKNASEILSVEGVDGVLVGGASLDPSRFFGIVKEGVKYLT